MPNIILDENGHLTNHHSWNQAIGQQIASADNFELNEKHWQIIELMREIYEKTGTSPPMRLFIKSIKLNIGDEIANSRYLYQLFPDGPVRLACKYAGLPKPKHCM